jgi:hypothetical protein
LPTTTTTTTLVGPPPFAETEPNDNPGQANTIEGDSATITGEVNGVDVDYFSIDVPEGSQVFEVICTDGTTGVIFVDRPDHLSDLVDCSPTGNRFAAFSSPAPGTYLLSKSDATGSYSFVVAYA